LSANLLPPPDGPGADIASLQATLSEWADDNADVVDQVDMIIGVDASSEDPAGGVIQRASDGEPNGVLEEYAFFTVLVSLLGELGQEGIEAFARAGVDLWASYGYKTAQDGRSSASIVEVLKGIGAAGELPIDVVAFPDSMRILSATVTRRTRSGDILGPAQRVDVMTALKAMTIWPAWQHFEEDRKGSIEPGKLADFVVLSADPTSVDPETLSELRVLATIKEDELVYEAAESSPRARSSVPLFPGDPAVAHVFLDVVHAAMTDR
jgi:predicted amidohydrolase YtcJ